MEAKFSPRVKDVICYSREEAIRLGHDYIGTEHLLLGLIREGDGKAIKTLKALDVDMIRLKKTIEDSIKIKNGMKAIRNLKETFGHIMVKDWSDAFVKSILFFKKINA